MALFSREGPVVELRSRTRGHKALGQHFLQDRRYLGPMLRAASLTAEDTVVEVGPGTGVLTEALIGQARRIVAVELDPNLAEALRQRFQGVRNLEVVVGDAREATPEDLLGGREPYKVVANLPYYAATPILRRFLEASHKPQLLVVMLQREVVQQMVAPPGKRSLLSVAIQFYGQPRVVGLVPPRAFRPPPKVTSAIVSIRVLPQPAVEVDSVEGFFGVVRGGFSAPRKQLRNALHYGLGLSPLQSEALLLKAGVTPTRRAETLTLEEWAGLYRASRSGSG
ncbi:MAG: ribosomal RNA small subunit methyltransferase A [Dehalococcoidia bacterium]|nr:ribosomal RNA small subunit methyltransferase A [Dehalococcoidia bacterium]